MQTQTICFTLIENHAKRLIKTFCCLAFVQKSLIWFDKNFPKFLPSLFPANAFVLCFTQVFTNSLNFYRFFLSVLFFIPNFSTLLKHYFISVFFDKEVNPRRRRPRRWQQFFLFVFSQKILSKKVQNYCEEIIDFYWILQGREKHAIHESDGTLLAPSLRCMDGSSHFEGHVKIIYFLLKRDHSLSSIRRQPTVAWWRNILKFECLTAADFPSQHLLDFYLFKK